MSVHWDQGRLLSGPVGGFEGQSCPVPDCQGPDGSPRPLRGLWRVCRSCGLDAQSDLTKLADQYVYLRLELSPGSTSGEHVSGGSGFASSSPVRDAVLSTMDELARWVIACEDSARVELTRPAVIRSATMPQAVAMMTAIRALTGRWWSPLMTSGSATMLVSGATYWRKRADVILGWNDLVHHLPAPCPYCDTLTLQRADGDSRVSCRRCQRSWLEAEYRHLVRMLLAQAMPEAT